MRRLITASFCPSPTASRYILKVAAILCSLHVDFMFATIDISRAFTHAEFPNKEDRIAVILPDVIRTRPPAWDGSIFNSPKLLAYEDRNGRIQETNQPGKNDHLLILFRPLYGARGAPLRWYCTLTQALAKHSIVVSRADSCVFTRRMDLEKEGHGFSETATKTISRPIVVHVEDIVFTGLKSDWVDLCRCLDEFPHGSWGILTPTNPIVFCGIAINISPYRIIALNRRSFYANISRLQRSNLIQGGEICVSPNVLQNSLMKFLGSMLWISQTRFDLMFAICQLGSFLPLAMSTMEGLKEFIIMANRLYNRTISLDLDLDFYPFPCNSPDKRYAQLIGFPDAPFGALRVSGSVESIILFSLCRRQGAGLYVAKGTFYITTRVN